MASCPEGYRKEIIGTKALLNCEPWIHSPRVYETKHAVAEHQCLECAVLNCSRCDCHPSTTALVRVLH